MTHPPYINQLKNLNKLFDPIKFVITTYLQGTK